MARPKKMRFKEGDFGVTNPGLFGVSDDMLRRLRPDLYGSFYSVVQTGFNLLGMYSLRDRIREHLWLGSIQPAVVVSADPGRVAAYSIELDCVALLGYEPDFLAEFEAREGTRLLAVAYYRAGPKDADLKFGPGNTSTWTSFSPIIADFVSDDAERLAERKAAMPEALWERTRELGVHKLDARRTVVRGGEPYAVVPTE